MMNESNTLPTLTKRLLALTAAVVMAWGCASQPERSRPTVNDLFSDALLASRVQFEDPAQQALQDTGLAGEGVDEPEAAPAAPAMMLPPDRDTPRVTEVFVETDLRQAVAALAAQAGVSVTLDPLVQGLANAVIEDEPFEVALQKLLMPFGFIYHRRGDSSYLIGVADPASALFPAMAQRHDYRPQHLAPEEMLELLAERYRPFVRVSDKHNLMIIEAPPALIPRIVWELEKSDQAVPQVVLEAIVCVFSPDDRFRFGLDFEQGLQVGGGDFMNMAVDNLGLAAALGPGDADIVRSFRFTSVFLRALAQEGYLAIRAAPRVMARSGEPAQISIGRETFFGVQPEVQHVLVRQEIKEVESGIMLDMRPVVRGNNILVHLERAEVSEDLRVDGMSQVNRFPVINRRRVSTTVDLKDGQTIVIGGLVQRRQVDQTGKIPVLGDIPGVGKLFQQVDRQDEQAEVAIFISAKIVGGRS